MINKEIILGNGNIVKDFSDRNIPQNSHNQVCVSFLIPSNQFNDYDDYSVLTAVSRKVGSSTTPLNALVLTASKSITIEGINYIKFSCVLSIDYTNVIGELYFSPYVQATLHTDLIEDADEDTEDIEVEVKQLLNQQSYTNCKLNIIRAIAIQEDASVEDLTIASTLASQINSKKIYYNATWNSLTAASENMLYYNIATSYNPSVALYNGSIVVIKNQNETSFYFPYLNGANVELLKRTNDGVFYKISGISRTGAGTVESPYVYNATKEKITYSKSEVDSIETNLQNQIDGKVDKTQKVNGHALSGDITITKGDVGIDLGNVANYGVDNTPSATGSNKYITSKAVYDALQVIYGKLNDIPTDASLEQVNDRLDAIEALIGSVDGDDDNVINTLREIITTLSGLGEDANILSLINSKASTSDLTAVENQIHQLLSTTTAPTESGDDLIISTSDIVGTSKENDLLMYIDSDNITTLYKITNITNGTATLSLIGNFATSGGTSVIANPTLTGTEDGLTSLQIGNTKYHIGEKPVLLWENTAQNQMPTGTEQFNSQNITLSEAYTNFKYLIFEFTGDFGAQYLIKRQVYRVESWASSKVVLVDFATGGEKYQRTLTFSNSTTISVGSGMFNSSTNNAALVPRYIYGCNDLSQLGSEEGTPITTFTPSSVAELHSVLTDITTNHLKNCRVYLPNETLDMASTFETYHDLPLGDDVEVIGQAKSKIVCHYLGSNATALENYSIFNKVRLNGGGFTLKNVVIEASRVRYCVHDDNGYNEDIYENNYINCDMKLDNTNNEAWTYNGQCIGGGFGKNGIVNIFDGSYIGKCLTRQSINQNEIYDISYHNSSHAQAQSRINIHNVYFGHTLRVSYYGSSTLMTKAIISNSSFLKAPAITQENAGYTTINCEMLQFNNVVREDIANAKKGYYDTLTTNDDGSITINKYTATYKITGQETLVNAHTTLGLISLRLPIDVSNGYTDFIANVPKFVAANWDWYGGKIFAIQNSINDEDGSPYGTRITVPTNPSSNQETVKRSEVASANIVITYKSATLLGTETIY